MIYHGVQMYQRRIRFICGPCININPHGRYQLTDLINWSPLESDPDETTRFRFKLRRSKRAGGAGGGEGDGEGELRSLPSTSKDSFGNFFIDVGAPNFMDRVGGVDLGFVAGLEVDVDSTTVEVGAMSVGSLVLMKTYGIDFPVGTGAGQGKFFTVLGSERRGFRFVVTSVGDLGWDRRRTSSVSSSELSERSMIDDGLDGLFLLTKKDGARGCGSGNSRSISSRVSSRVFWEVEAAGCCRGVGEPKRSAR